MSKWSCVILGEPVGKGRPRFVRSTGRVYTPDKTASWEAHAVATMRQGWQGAPIDAPVVLFVLALFGRPARLRGKQHAGEAIPHVTRPDADNVAKAACDALEKAGVVRNDSQVWCIDVTKRHVFADEAPGVTMSLQW